MTDELRYAFIILGALAIGGILVHGLLTVRKQNELESTGQAAPVDPSQSGRAQSDSDEGIVGEARTMARANPAVEPKLDLDDELSFSAESDAPVMADDSADDVPTEPDVVIFHVAMPEGQSMAGAALMQQVLTFGLKYCEEQQIFERRQDAAGHGEVLFRLVNSFNPGTFDIDNMEMFNTAGVSLFMTLPLEPEVDTVQAFNMLAQAAKKLAEGFGATVLDANREPVTAQTLQRYAEKAKRYDGVSL